MKNQRKLSNYIRSAGLFRGYYFVSLFAGVIVLGGLTAYASSLLGEVNAVVAEWPEPALAAGLQQRVLTAAVLFLIGFTVFVFFSAYYLIVLGQRVGGPLVAICAYIDELQKGNYSAKRTLRKNDELVQIMDKLHALARTLEEKRKS